MCLSARLWITLLLAVLGWQTTSLYAAENPQGYIAPIRVNTVAELSELLVQAEALTQLTRSNPVMFVLHGDEARSFIRENYRANQSLVDLSAKLTALGVVQIEICERWMGSRGVLTSDLQPFVKTVQYAPTRISALKDKGYIYF